MHRDSDVGVFGTSGVDAHVPSHTTRNVKPPPDSTTKQPSHPNWETDSVDTEGLLGSTAQLAIDLTESDSSSADQSDPRNRAQIDTSSVAPPADATSSETGSVHRESAPTTTDTRTVVTVSNGTVDADQSGARKRARVDTSSTASAANVALPAEVPVGAHQKKVTELEKQLALGKQKQEIVNTLMMKLQQNKSQLYVLEAHRKRTMQAKTTKTTQNASKASANAADNAKLNPKAVSSLPSARKLT